MEERVHYIWITWKSVTGSADSLLWKNGNFPLDEARKAIEGLSIKALYKARPKWISQLSEISISAQNLFTSDVLHRRTITVTRRAVCKA